MRGVDFDSDLTSNPDWAGSYANHVDLPRIREGRLGGQVCINPKYYVEEFPVLYTVASCTSHSSFYIQNWEFEYLLAYFDQNSF